MPSAKQNQVLLGLESGRKLFELLRDEPGMPAKALIEEWRDNDPVFEQAYQAAEEAGRVKRGEPKPAAPKPVAAPTVQLEDGQEQIIPRSTALSREPAPAPVLTKKQAALAKARQVKADKRASGQGAPEATPPSEATIPDAPAAPAQPAPAVDASHIWAEVQKLQGFKTYVHERLTAAGIDECEAANAVNGCRIGARLDEVFAILDGYRLWQTDVLRLTRELDVALFGENAAQQASLCDLIGPARDLAKSLNAYVTRAEQRDQDPVQEVSLALNAEPSGPEHPGAILTSLMRKAGTRRAQLAAGLGIKSETLKELLACRASLSLALCGRLEKLCWGTAETWARRQVDYDNHRQSLSVAA
jgi:plasmid maintenance system antidote protein VapI